MTESLFKLIRVVFEKDGIDNDELWKGTMSFYSRRA